MNRRTFLAGSMLAVAGSGCRLIDSPFAGTFKLGFVAPFSGRDYAGGYNVLFAVKLALKELNERGGIAGWRAELLAQDDRNDAEAGRNQARKMANDPDVVAVIGHPSSVSALQAAPEYQRVGLPFVALATSDSLAGDAVLRIGPSDSILASWLSSFLVNQFEANRLALVAADSAGGKLAEIVGKKWWASRGPVVFGDGLPPEPTDFGPIVDRIVASRPDAVFYAGGVEVGAPLYAELRRVHTTLPFIAAPSCVSPHFARLSGSPTDQAYLLAPGPDPAEIPKASNFVRDYRALWGVDPWPQAAFAFDAVQMVLAAIARSGAPSRDGILTALFDGQLVDGLTGQLAFDAGGNRIDLQPAVYRLIGNRFPGERQKT